MFQIFPNSENIFEVVTVFMAGRLRTMKLCAAVEKESFIKTLHSELPSQSYELTTVEGPLS